MTDVYDFAAYRSIIHRLAQTPAASVASLQMPDTALPSLLVDGFDAEQIWGELELLNGPLMKALRSKSKKLAVLAAEVCGYRCTIS